MRIFVSLFLLLSAFAALSSCVSLSKDQCLESDWNSIGIRDGRKGEHPDKQFTRHVKACKRLKILPDYTLWWQGYQTGLIDYCTPLSGLANGQHGRNYYYVCPTETANGFVRGYNIGRKEFSIRISISSSESSIRSYNIEIDNLIDKMAKAKPGEISDIKTAIKIKTSLISDAARSIKNDIPRLLRIEQLVEEFKADPQMKYDPAILRF